MSALAPAPRPLPPLVGRVIPAALLVAGGALGALVPVLHPGHGPGYYLDPATASSHLLLVAAVLATSLGLPALVRDGAGLRVGAAAGAACYFVGLWCLDGTHGLVDGAVMPALAATQPAAAALLAGGHASQELLAGGPMGAIVDAGIGLFAAGSLLLGVAIARARRLPRAVGWAFAVAWAGVPVSMFVPELRLAALAFPYAAVAAAGAALASFGARAAAPAAPVVTAGAPGAVGARGRRRAW